MKPTLVMDIECYRNYFLVMFKSVDTGKVRKYEIYDDVKLDQQEIRIIMSSYKVVTFNGNNYDLPILQVALRGATCDQLKRASDRIIMGNMRGWQFEIENDIKRPREWDHIDLIEVAFGQGSLKLYGGRLHSHKLQDLPIEPDATISADDREQLRTYCVNDLDTTIDLYKHLLPQLELREHMTAEYGEDLRSKSDAQIAEAVIRKQCSAILGEPVKRPEIPAGTSFKYKAPDYLVFSTPTMKAVLCDVLDSTFYITDTGGVSMPPALNERAVSIGSTVYRLGIGGLHSSEQAQAYVSTSTHVLRDHDAASFYPAIILNCDLAPAHLRNSDAFKRVYGKIVQRRIEAKHRGDKVVSDSLKITINGGYGKFGSKYSTLYSPQLMIQVTITGQLSLLMLIESLENNGVKVVSGNTDGIVLYCPRVKEQLANDLIADWEKRTGFVTEETRYKAVFSRDINSYFALKESGGIKGKGAFAPPSISKNPKNSICVEAVSKLLTDGVPVGQTIRECTDVRKFVEVRTVRGGAVQITHSNYNDSLTPGKKRDVLIAAGWIQTVPGPLTKARFTYMRDEPDYDVETAYRMYCGKDETRYIGKVVRWYIGAGCRTALHYKDTNKSGGRNKVPSSDGAVPLMQLPDTLPSDIDYGFYIREANDILVGIGYTPEKETQLLFGDSF